MVFRKTQKTVGGEAELDEWTFVTTARLIEDTRRLQELLPPDLDAVIAISRSGVVPGGLISYYRHLPLWTVSRQAGLQWPGHGFRMEGDALPHPRHVLLIDDTAARGTEMRACLPVVQAAFPDASVLRAVVYCHPQARAAVDLWTWLYPGVHFLEWNWPNTGLGAICGYDWDGVLSHDCSPEQDDAGPKYLRFLQEAKPLHLPRREPVPLIATARHERYRAVCEEWLARYGVRAQRLAMRDWGSDPPVGYGAQIAAWKAEEYRRSSCRFFAESDPEQAGIIAERSGKAVICPGLERVLPGGG